MLPCTRLVSGQKSSNKAPKQAASNWNHDLLKGFTFVQELGKGATGSVALFTDDRSGRKVAIKRMKVATNKDYPMKKLLREINCLKKFSESETGRQHVTELLDVFVDDSDSDTLLVFLVLEYLPYTLKSFLDRQKQITVQMATKILYRLLCALNLLQSARVLHRDLKPENILIDDDLNVKLCDFGLARYYRKQTRSFTDRSKEAVVEKLRNAEGSRKERRRELSNHVVSRWYRSPEVILLQRYDSKSDLWSLGCILAELLMSTAAYSKEALPPHEKILFPGLSCFPLSPRGFKPATQDYDQLPILVNILGDQQEDDVAFITDQETREFVLGLKRDQKKIDFAAEFQSTDSRFAQLLENMLEFNPYFRATPKQLLQSSLFDDVRDPRLQLDAAIRAKLPFDEAGAYDYEEQQPLKYSQGELTEYFKRLVKSISNNNQ